MSNWMQKYFNAQSEVLSKVIRQGSSDAREYALQHSQFGRICLIGSGSSFHCARTQMENLKRLVGCEILAMLPGRVDAFQHRPDDLILLITQEGKSVNVMRAAERLRERGARFSVLTAVENSPIACLAESCLYMRCGEEKTGPKTKGVLATLIMLELLGLELGLKRKKISQSHYDKEILSIEETVRFLPENIALCRTWVEQQKDVLTQSPFITVLSVAPLCFLGCEGALKLVETVYIPAVSYEFEEFIHGPHCLLGTDMTIIALYHGLPDENRLRTLCAFAREKGTRVLEISDMNEANGFDGLKLRNGGWELCPMHFLLPFQAASAYLAEWMGHDLDRPKFPGFATQLQSKLY